MTETILQSLAGLEPLVLLGLLAASFAGSFITVAMGIGGGVLLLSVMASLLPPVALIPVHGVIQLGSNLSRAVILSKHTHWQPVLVFAIGSVLGVALGGAVVIDLPASMIQIGIGCFVIWSVLSKPPAWLSHNPFLVGSIASFLTMFFGATGVFVGNFTKSLNLQRQSFVATHAVLMTLQHFLKVVVFGLLGFAFGPWLLFIALMIASGVLGTLVGRMVLIRIAEKTFRHLLNIILLLISLRLIWIGVVALM
jgi:uncharacterized protein